MRRDAGAALHISRNEKPETIRQEVTRLASHTRPARGSARSLHHQTRGFDDRFTRGRNKDDDPFLLQLPPSVAASAIVSGFPGQVDPFQLVVSEELRDRPSGAQNAGKMVSEALFVPGRARATGEFRERIHNTILLVSSGAQKAIWRPSGR